MEHPQRIEIYYSDHVTILEGIGPISVEVHADQIEVTYGGMFGGGPADVFRRFIPGLRSVTLICEAQNISHTAATTPEVGQ